jgi:hypothetical protein
MFAWTREERIIRTNRTLELSLQAAGSVSCAACAWLATRTDSRRTPARTPRLRSRPIRGPGPPAGRPARRSAGAAATPGCGSDPCRRNRPRSRRATAVRITACCSCRVRDWRGLRECGPFPGPRPSDLAAAVSSGSRRGGVTAARAVRLYCGGSLRLWYGRGGVRGSHRGR